MELYNSPQLRMTKCQIIYAHPLNLAGSLSARRNDCDWCVAAGSPCRALFLHAFRVQGLRVLRVLVWVLGESTPAFPAGGLHWPHSCGPAARIAARTSSSGPSFASLRQSFHGS